MARQSQERRENPMKSPYQAMRLSFPSLDAYREFDRRYPTALPNIWAWGMAYGNRPEPFRFKGICEACDELVEFSATPQPCESPDFKHIVHWREHAQCSSCRLAGLDRFILRVLDENYSDGQCIYHVGHFSPFRKWLSAHFPSVTSSQYQEGRAPGETEGELRFEDLTQLSFADHSFDFLIAMEILEHVPDYHLAIREMARVLKPGGKALLSFPWLGLEYEHLIRAEMIGGKIVHHMEPEYHGDPAKNEGILSFRAFGWKILEELRAAGFAKATSEYVFAPIHGYMDMVPIFLATR
jgi:hypothetical protein